MTFVVGSVFVALLGAGSSSAAHLPTAWWVVEASSGHDVGKPGTAWHLGTELTAIDPERTAARRTAVACVAWGERTWHCERGVAGTLHTLDVVLRPDGQLVVTLARAGEPPYGQMTARQARPSEALDLEVFAKKAHAEDVAACGRARACYQVACPAFEDKDDPCIFERHSMSHDATNCTALVPMLVSTLQVLNKPIPPQCAPR